MYYLASLTLKHFRNYRSQFVEFEPGLNIFSGLNAQGKTNLLEAIYYLSVTRSFRTKRDQELTQIGEQFFFLKGCFWKDEIRHNVQISYQRNSPFRIYCNNEKVERFLHIREFPVVVFSPDDLMIIRDSPAIRRRFLNLEISKFKGVYFQNLTEYQRVLLQRNRLLKEQKYSSQLDKLIEPWDQALSSLGTKIIHDRLEMIADLETEARFFFHRMYGEEKVLSLKYQSNISFSDKPDETRIGFYKTLSERRRFELKRGSTMYGPHLDDLKILINGEDTRLYSSQGQKRTAALALKMGEAMILKGKTGLDPIILLDDVFSEFDRVRRESLLFFLKENRGQCFLTTAVNIDGLLALTEKDYKIITVDEGRIISETGGSSC
ncbi:MAG TPA: DNA replication/repair protein RecF [Candidatus Marinimicrobia bacterium]|nr:DNA replication/repair protein RecF [Candidatus Neomarinimicrobiota bacterium]